jgi:uncharacterized protein YjbJ (UPF0337 family)
MNQELTKEKIETKNHQIPDEKGDWEQSKTNAKQIWSNLTEDDFSKANGSAEKLCSIIQARFGDAPEEIQSKLNELPAPITAKPNSEAAAALNEGLGWAQKRFSYLGVRVDELMLSNRKKWGVFKLEMRAALGAMGAAFKRLAD